MTVNSSCSTSGSTCLNISSRFFVAFCALALLAGLIAAPAPARAADVTSLDKLQVALSLSSESTATTVLSMSMGVAPSEPLPCTFQFIVPGGYEKIITQGEFDTDPSKPTAQTQATKVSTDDNGTTYSVTLTKSHNFFFAASMSVSIYNYGAMGNGGVPLAAFTLTPATDVSQLLIAIAPPAANMVGTGGDTIKSFKVDNNVTLYGQSFTDVKKGTAESVQVAFATDQQAQQGQTAAQQKAQAQAASGFFAQPVVWILGVALVLVLVVLVAVIMRQRRGMAPGTSGDDSDEESESYDFNDDDDDDDTAEGDASDDSAAADDDSDDSADSDSADSDDDDLFAGFADDDTDDDAAVSAKAPAATPDKDEDEEQSSSASDS